MYQNLLIIHNVAISINRHLLKSQRSTVTAGLDNDDLPFCDSSKSDRTCNWAVRLNRIDKTDAINATYVKTYSPIAM